MFNIFFGAIMEAVIERTKDLGVKFRYKPGGDIFKVGELKKKKGVEQIRLMDLLFADDAALMTTDCPVKLQKILDVFVEVTDAYGQEVLVKKTEVMWVGKLDLGAQPPRVDIRIKGQQLKGT